MINTNEIITNIPVGTYPYGVSASLDGSKVYVTNFTAQSVSVINTSTNSVIDTIPVGNYPVGIFCIPESNRVYVVNEIHSTLCGSSYCVVLKHRNAMETWSKNLVLFTGSTVTFDFTAP